MTQSAISLERIIPEEVLSFCLQRRMRPHLETALHLADQHFGPSEELRVSVETDPETCEKVIAVDLTLAMDVAEVVRRKQSYTRDWVQQAPPEARERIRLLYNIV